MANNNPNTTSEKRKSVISVDEPQPFEPTLKSKYMTTTDLCKTINGLFRPIFVDYEGCLPYTDGNGNILLNLYFRDKGLATNTNKIKNIKPFNQVNSNDIMERIKAINNSSRGRNVDITEETKEALYEFMAGPNKNNNVDWSKCITESSEPNGFNSHSVYATVSGLDVIKIIKKIYGSFNEEGNYLDYRINIIRPIGVAMSGTTNSFLLMISQLDTKMVESMCNEIGVVPTQGTIPIVRD